MYHDERSASHRRRRLRDKLLFGIGLIVLWELVATWQGPFFLPRLERIVVDGATLFFSEGYWKPFIDTWVQLFAGFGITCIVMIPLGLVVGWFRSASQFLTPYVNSLFVTPTIAILPLLIIITGTGMSFRIVVVILFSYYYPLMQTRAGVIGIPNELRELIATLCLSPFARFSKVVLPAIRSNLVAGVRLGLGMAVQGMIIAELWITAGTGQILLRAVDVRRLDVYYFVIFLIVFFAAMLAQILKVLEQRLLANPLVPVGNGA